MKVCHSLLFVMTIGFSSVISQYIETSALHEQTQPETSHPENSNAGLVKSSDRQAQSKDALAIRSSPDTRQGPSEPVLGGSLIGDIFKIEKGIVKGGKTIRKMKRFKWSYLKNMLGYIPNIYQNQDSQNMPHHHTHSHHHPHYHQHHSHHSAHPHQQHVVQPHQQHAAQPHQQHAQPHQQHAAQPHQQHAAQPHQQHAAQPHQQHAVHPHQQHDGAHKMVPGHHLNDAGHSHVQTQPHNNPVKEKHVHNTFQMPDITINEEQNDDDSSPEVSSEEDNKYNREY